MFAMASVSLIFHCFTLGVYFFVIWYSSNFVRLPEKVFKKDIHLFKGRLHFFTTWNLILQVFFFSICLVNDAVGTNELMPKKSPFIRKLRDLVLACLAFPIALCVGVSFWTIYFIDRELVFPSVFDSFFPNWLNHAVHTNVVFFVLVELFISFKQYPSRKIGLKVLSVFMFTYIVWIHVIRIHSGIWVYPFLEVLNFPLRIIYFISMGGLCGGLYLFGEKLNNVIWSRKLRSLKKYQS